MKPRRTAITWRSGLEEAVAAQLTARGIAYKYESFSIPFVEPEKRRRYTPDFLLLDNGIVVETKGRFIAADRAKHLLVRAQYPDLDLRFVFQNANARISKVSATTYAAWADKNQFVYANKRIPEAWLYEPRNERSLSALAAFLHRESL